MEQTAMVQKVLEAGKDQPIGVAAIILVMGLQFWPVVSGSSLDPEIIPSINERTKYIERATKESKASMAQIGHLSGTVARHIDKTSTGHRDIEKSIAHIIDMQRGHESDIKDVFKVVTDNQHLFDILKLRLDALERNGSPSSGRILRSPFLGNEP